MPFENMERVMRYINARPDIFGFKLIYSTPADYFSAIGANGTVGARSFPEFHGDFLPAAFTAHYVRSGFYTSRPASKAIDRAVWARGHAAKLLQTLRSLRRDLPGKGLRAADEAIAAVDAAVGVHQHHDAMSGTDLAFVAQNYMDMMTQASGQVTAAAAAIVSELAGVEGDGAGCEMRNVSICPAMRPLQQGHNVSLTVFNPLGVARSEVVEVPVPIPGVVVTDTFGHTVPSEVHPAAFVGEQPDTWGAAWMQWWRPSPHADWVSLLRFCPSR